MSTLVIGAHPDDETLGCGGTIAKIAAEGEDVHLLILGEGITSRSENRENCQEQIDVLQQNSREAAKTLGAKSIDFHSFPDNMFDSVPLLRIVKTIENYIQKFSPETVFSHHGGDLNIDHSIVFRATLTAARPCQKNQIKQIFTYEIPSSTDWSFSKLDNTFNPNHFINISDFLDIKIKAMNFYESEKRKFPHPRSTEAIEALAKIRGSMAGLNACEAFTLIKSIKY